MTKKVAIMKGDGIGPEIVDAMTGILKEYNLLPKRECYIS